MLIVGNFATNAAVTKWVDFNLKNGHIKIPASISNIDTYAILDSGAQLNAINLPFMKKHKLEFDLGPKIKIKGVYGVSERRLFKNVPVGFFGIQTELNDVVGVSFGDANNGLIFGAGFFKNFVVQLDYPNERMRLITHDSIDVSKFENIDMTRQKVTGSPIVKVEFPDSRPMWLLLDTGNAGGIIVERKVASSKGWTETLDSQLHLSGGVNRAIESESFRVPKIQFGPFQLENVLVTIPEEGQSSQLVSQYEHTSSRIKGKKVEGLIGYDVLKHFLITLDYKNGHAHIGLPE